MHLGRAFIAGGEVVGSGTFVSLGYEPIAVRPFTPSDGLEYEVEIRFSTDGGNVRVDTTPITDSHFLVELRNFDEPFPVGTTERIHVANLEGLPVYLFLVSQTIGTLPQVVRVTHLTLTVDAEGGVGHE